jgi:hypothetical protein
MSTKNSTGGSPHDLPGGAGATARASGLLSPLRANCLALLGARAPHEAAAGL